MNNHPDPLTQQKQKKKSKLNKLIDSLQSLKLCNHHFHQQHTPPPPPPPTTTKPPSHSNPSITFPVPKPFKHPSHSSLVQPNPVKLDLNLNPCLSSPPLHRPKPTHKPITNQPSVSTSHIQSPYSTPTKPSTPSSPPTATPTSVTRCCGTTREGKPCSRKPMKTLSPSTGQSPINISQKLDELDQILVSSSSPLPPSESLVPRFCFQHYQKANSQSGAFFGKSIWIEYSDWFASELPEDVKITLKTEMSKQPTEKDRNEQGYLYCHEMRPTSGRKKEGSTGTYIKVGRSTRPVARLGEWSKQCPSRTPIVRGFFPEFSNSNDQGKHQQACYLDGLQSVSPQGIRFHRKWERLALVELHGWALLQRKGRPKLPCPDCKKVHLELFELDHGSYERLVKPMILKWQKWCQFAYL